MKNKGKSDPNEAKNSFVMDKKCLEKVITWKFDSG